MPELILTKYSHACVALSSTAASVLIDPGSLGELPLLDDFTAILVTHDHYDHADPTFLSYAVDRGIPIWMPSDAAGRLNLTETVHSVSHGECFEIGKLRVRVLGGPHAPVHPEVDGPMNCAYLIDERVLVTGDAHPEVPPHINIETLVTPIDAPWLRATDLISYVRTVRPKRVVGVHEGLLNSDGLSVAQSVLASLTREGALSAHLPQRNEVLAV